MRWGVGLATAPRVPAGGAVAGTGADARRMAEPDLQSDASRRRWPAACARAWTLSLSSAPRKLASQRKVELER
eukprot:462010-Prymnesium_polylepis.1